MMNNKKKLSAAIISTSLFAMSGGVTAGALTGSISGSVTDGAIWGGAAPVFNEDLAKTPDLVPTVGLDAIVTPSFPGPIKDLVDTVNELPGVNIPTSFGTYGVKVGLDVTADVALRTQITDFHKGTVDLNYGADVQIEFPDLVERGETYTITSSWGAKADSSFSTKSDEGKTAMGADFRLEADLVAKACFVNCFLDAKYPPGADDHLIDESFYKPLIEQTNTTTTLRVADEISDALELLGAAPLANPTIDQSEISISGNISSDLLDTALGQVTNMSGTLGAPDIETESTLTGNVLESKGTDVFTDITVDLDGFTKFPLGETIKEGNVEIGYNIFDASVVTSLIEQQEFSFEGAPVISLDLSSLGLGEVEFMAGESFTFTVPEKLPQTEMLEFDANVLLDGIFTNITSLAAVQDTLITVGELIVKLPGATLYAGDTFCILGVPFTDLCAEEVTIPALKFPSIDFREAILDAFSVTDELFDLGPLSVNTCTLTPSVCDNLDLFGVGKDGASNFESYTSSVTYALGSDFLGKIQIAVVPAPGSLLLMILGFTLLVGGRTSSRKTRV